ncbi:MAG: hypothetical protein J0L75_15230 [Spirochaetes bacterium]|nr:hypothetical protein [Spirochaetota bacterium]
MDPRVPIPYAHGMKTDMERALSAGEHTQSTWPGDDIHHIHPYLGSGRMGASFDPWGLMGNGWEAPHARQGLTALMHSGHFHRGRLGIQSRIPLGRLVFADGEPAPPTEWSQRFTPGRCLLTTRASGDGFAYEMRARFHAGRPDLLLLEIDGRLPDLLFAPCTGMKGSYDEQLTGSWETRRAGADSWRGSVRLGTAQSAVVLRVLGGGSALEPEGRGVRWSPRGGGPHFLALGVAPMARGEALEAELATLPDPATLADEAQGAWKRRFGDAFVELGDARLQSLWARSLASVLYSYAPDTTCPAPPCGWSGNLWGYTFPQDLSYIHPALLRLGHLDIAKSWVEFFSGFRGEMERFTRRIWNRPGAFWAWEFPVEHGQDLLDPDRPGEPNWYQYEIHNASTVVRMAVEKARHLGDPAFTRDVALPMALSTARFYASGLERNADGAWDLFMEPSMGQDEMGAPNQRNYLCGLFAAEYALGAALALLREAGLGDPDAPRWAAILRDGLAYARLMHPELGVCGNDESVAGDPLGRQKHPVQVNPLFVLPFEAPHPHALHAYRAHRLDLCRDSRRGHYHGWTLWAYLASAAHAGDAAGLGEMSANLQRYHAVDADYLQAFETSCDPSSFGDLDAYRRRPWVHYVTSHGLFMQAVQDALICDYGGRVVKHGAVPPSWGTCRYAGLRTMDGAVHSGEARGAAQESTGRVAP